MHSQVKKHGSVFHDGLWPILAKYQTDHNLTTIKLFHLLSAKGKATATKKDVVKGLKDRLKIEVTKKQIDNMFKELDKNDDGYHPLVHPRIILMSSSFSCWRTSYLIPRHLHVSCLISRVSRVLLLPVYDRYDLIQRISRTGHARHQGHHRGQR